MYQEEEKVELKLINLNTDLDQNQVEEENYNDD